MAARKISNVTAQEKSAAEGVMTDVFSRFAAGDKIDEDGLKRFVSEAGLLDADMGLDEAAVGMIFQSVKVGKKPGLNFDLFKDATRKVAVKKELTYHECVFLAGRNLGSGGGGGGGGDSKESEQANLNDAQIAAYAAAFKAVDTDQSGHIDRSELAKVCKALGEDDSPDTVAGMLKEMDMDGDGTVSFDEFVVMMAARKGVSLNEVDKAAVGAAKRMSTVAGRATGAVLHAGWMTKRSTTGRIKNWKKRWFTLRSDRLQYFATEEDAAEGKLKGEVVFVDGMIVEERGEDQEPKKADCFLVTGNVDLYVVVEDAAERTAWMEKIQGAYMQWQDAIRETLALLVGPDPSMAAAAMMAQGADYMNFRQNDNGIALSPFYVQMGKPVPVVFGWDWDETGDVTGVQYSMRKLSIKGLTVEAEETLAVADGKAKATLRPGAGYSFKWLKGDAGWLSPMQEEPNLLYKLKRVPLLGDVLDALPEEMQKKVTNLPEGKVRTLLEKIASIMPVNTFDVQAAVTVDYGIYTAEVQQMTGMQKALQIKEMKFNDPTVRFALRVGLLTGAITAIAKGFELVGLGFLAVWLKESVSELFLPAPEATEDGILKLANKKDADGAHEYDGEGIEQMTKCWEGERDFYQNELNEKHMEFLGGLRVRLPDPQDVLRAARTRLPDVEDGATVPVLFQWCDEAASEVTVKYCEVKKKFDERIEAEGKAKQEAKIKWKAEQTAIMKKKLGIDKVAEDEEVPALSAFKYEAPPRETIAKEWKEVKLERTPGAGDGPVDPHKKRLAKAAHFADVPLPAGDYCVKFYVDGTAYYQEGKPIPEDSDSEYRMMRINISTAFGLGFDVGV